MKDLNAYKQHDDGVQLLKCTLLFCLYDVLS
jgi:hypothetical protein